MGNAITPAEFDLLTDEQLERLAPTKGRDLPSTPL